MKDNMLNKNSNPFLVPASRPPLVIAHRGGAGLKPENTMSAFIHAVNLGVDMLEVDVRLTADGHLVTHHDSTIDRMSNGRGKIAQITYRQLKEFNFSSGFNANITQPEEERGAEEWADITLLQDVLKDLDEVLLTVEIKDEEERGRRAADRLMKLIKKYSYQDKIIVGSFHDEVLSYLQNKYTEYINISASKKKVAKFVITNMVKLDRLFNFNITALQIPTCYHRFNLARPGLIKAAHRKNIAVHFWTVNEPTEMKRLIELNADGIMTDRPDILLDIIKQK